MLDARLPLAGSEQALASDSSSSHRVSIGDRSDRKSVGQFESESDRKSIGAAAELHLHDVRAADTLVVPEPDRH